LLPDRIGQTIAQVCEEMIAGDLDAHFLVDIFQTGSGTSIYVNANEVIANRAIQILGGVVGSRTPIHPNDHVNLCQSSNNVIPTAIHVAGYLSLRAKLIPALQNLEANLGFKAKAFADIVKTRRIHLQDATPIRLGQEFNGYATQAKKSTARAKRAMLVLRELPLGGTAVGTGLNRPSEFPQRAITQLNQKLEADFYETENPIEANAARDGIVEVLSFLKVIVVSSFKIANDIRWLSSCPRNGLGEIQVPVVQPRSSIMPEKVNPVKAEALMMVTAQVIEHDAAITQAGLGGNFELNTMVPIMAHNLLKSIEWLSTSVALFTERCVGGLEANEKRCQEKIDRSLALATGLTPVIGYDRAAEISKEAQRSERTIHSIVEEQNLLPAGELEEALNPYHMTETGLARKQPGAD
jgi:fumarate hydratase class II